MTTEPDPSQRPPEVDSPAQVQGLGVRFLLLLLFVILLNMLQLVGSLLAIAQFLFVWLGGGASPRLRRFGNGLARYVAQIVRYLGWGSERPPYPFGPWPGRASGTKL